MNESEECFNILKPEQYSHHFADNIFDMDIVEYRLFSILTLILLKFVPKCPVDNKLVSIGSGNGFLHSEAGWNLNRCSSRCFDAIWCH